MKKMMCFLLACGLMAVQASYAMNLNVACPWDDVPSSPQISHLAFYSHQGPGMLFEKGEQIDITCQAGLRSIGLKWSLCRNMLDTPFRTGQAEALPANRFRIAFETEGLIPGFYDIHVELDTGSSNVVSRNRLEVRPVKGVCTFGWRPADMPITDSRPADFNAFWEAAKANLSQIPLAPREGKHELFDAAAIADYNVKYACLPPDYNPAGHRCETVESFKVDFAGPDGGRVYGWLARPAHAEGKKFPAMLVLPGAGITQRPRPLEHARHGYVAMDIHIHGLDVDLETYPGNLPGYYDPPKDVSAKDYYYYNVHLRCLQAVSYLASRPDVDASRIVVVGGSQGGRLSVVVAGLDTRIAAAVPAIAHFANQPYLKFWEACNRAKNDGMQTKGLPPNTPHAYAYYDPMNFAPDIRCPIFFNAGLTDTVSPAQCIWAIYNRIPEGVEKHITPLDGHGHDWSAAFDRNAWRWLDTVFEKQRGN